MPAPNTILKLCDNFARHLDHYKKGKYNETQVRREFLDPFFKALGWDVGNEQGYADAYKDVIHEDAIKIGGYTKAPDYCFRIGGTRKFFLEAKKPSVNIKDDIAPAYQLRRYAWSAKLPLSILSDFEELAIYDCRIRPGQKDKSSTARVKYFTFDQYAERWDEIESIFSRDAVLKGSFDKYAESSKKKRGTAEVDDAFLEEIERWRTLLARNFALRNDLDVRDINYAVQKTIDRLIFLRMCEDRGTEDYGRLMQVVNGTNCWDRLREQFTKADDRYNSGLFHFTSEKGRVGAPDTLTPSLTLDDKCIKDIVKHLYYPESPYEFSVLPADILGQVYEQFLGKTIRLTSAHQAKIEEKPEVRKAGGVYYTPKYIVDYIVENTLGRLLNGSDPEKTKPISTAKAAKLKVLDPACGSGSFLIVAYQYLLDWHRDQYTLDAETKEPDNKKSKRHAAGKNPKIYQARGDEWKLTTAERKRILLNNIHGVDIDSQAVEVTKLSLLLKVLEGETQQVVERDWIKERQRILPDLGNNIQCGNSLIGPDFYDQPNLPEMDDETRYRINVFDWHEAFPEVFEQGGFDCVVGNPPYDVLEKERGKSSWPHSLLASYSKKSELLSGALGGKLNLFRFFLTRCTQLASSSGNFGMIVPLSIIADVSCARTRSSLLSDLKKVTADCFPQKDIKARRIFKDAKLSTVVITGSRTKTRNFDSELILRIYPGKSFKEPHIFNRIRLKELKFIDKKNLPIPVCSEHSWSLLTKIHAQPITTMAGKSPDLIITRGEINQTTYRNHITTNQLDSRLMKGVEIARFAINTELSQGHQEWLNESGYLAAKKPREDTNCQRIATQRITGMDEYWRIVSTLVTPPAYFADSTNSIRLSKSSQYNLYFFLGILNSRLIQWCFKAFSSNNNVATNELDLLPIRTIDFKKPTDVEQHDKMVGLVERILTLNENKASEKNPEKLRHIVADIQRTDRQIDRLVYDLYELSEEEIQIVENGS